MAPTPAPYRELTTLAAERPNDSGPVVRRLRWSAAGRVGVLSLLSISTYLTFSDSLHAPTPHLLFVTSLALLALNCFALAALRKPRAKTIVGGVTSFGDLVFASVIVYLTGGAESAFSVLFHLSVIVAGFVFGSRGSWTTALCAASLFTAESMSIQGGWLVVPFDLAEVPTMEDRELLYYIGVNGVSLAIVAALTGYLSELERRVGGKLAEAQRMSADLAALTQDIVRSLTVGLAVTDANGDVSWINPAGAEMLGLQNSLADGERLKAIVDFPRPPDVAAFEGETTFKKDSGEVLVIAYRIAPLLDGAGSVRGSILVFQDETNLRKMQNQVERAERLAALGRLAAGLAHEMRNPLGSISGSLELLYEGGHLDGDEQKLVEINLGELERLASLVTQMLDLARPRSPRPQTVDLAPLIADVTRAIKTSAEAEELTFHLDVPEHLPAQVDADQMKQLLWNLLRNAAQASPPETNVYVKASVEGSSLVLHVRDEGPGISVDDRDRVFDPFFSTKRGGIGMGLAICKQVVVGHGGSMAVDAGETNGCAFRVVLPLHPTGDARDADDESGKDGEVREVRPRS